jgi:hypothetical protein
MRLGNKILELVSRTHTQTDRMKVGLGLLSKTKELS